MRKINFLTLSLLIMVDACNFYGDVDLGSDFYYLVEPAFNCIAIPVNPDDPYKSSIDVIQGIESIGFNDSYIIATSKAKDTLKYWIIDKSKESKKLGYDINSNIKLSNVTEIDSIEFERIREKTKIELKTKSDYRKALNYE